MIHYFRRTLSDNLRHHTLLYLLTLFGTALGVASVVAIGIINTNAIGAFEASVDAGRGGADLQVLPAASGLPEELLSAALQTPGVAAAWPVVEGQLRTSGRGRLDLLGLDLATPRVGPDLVPADFDLSGLLSTPGWVAVDATTARRLGWTEGDEVGVLLGSEPRRLVVGRILEGETPFGAGVDLVADIATAQDLFATRGQLQRIGLRLRADADLDETAGRLQQRLGEGVRIATPEQQLEGAEQLLEAFRLNLTALSYISLLVGLFLIYSSVQSSLLRRREEFGLLRSTGMTRLQVMTLILAEAGLIGCLGLAFGLPLGYQAAEQSLGMINATLTSIYLLRAIEQLEVSNFIYAQATAVGLLGALGGALLPAFDMSLRNPRELLANLTLERRVAAATGTLFLIGSGILALAGGWYWLGGSAWRPAGFVLGAAVLLALPLQIPLVLQAVCGRIPVTRFGIAFSLRSLAARLRVTAFAAAALGVAASMLVGITVLVGSFRSTVQDWIEATIVADIYITSVPQAGASSGAGLDDSLVARLESLDGVVGADRLRLRTARVGGRRVQVSGVRLFSGGIRRYPLREGSRLEALAGLRDGRLVLISEPLARRLGSSVGDRVAIETATGPVPLEVGGVTYDYSNDSGTVVMSLDRFGELFGSGQPSSMALYLDESLPVDAATAELRAELAGLGLSITSSGTLRQQALRLFDQTFGVVWLLQLMSLLIAVTGIALTLLILAREQRSEIALYRALGALPGQVARYFIGKGLGLGGIGLAAGAAGGSALAAILIVVINRAYFGWTIRVDIPWSTLSVQALLLLLAAAAASLYPALRASRTPATELSRDDA